MANGSIRPSFARDPSEVLRERHDHGSPENGNVNDPPDFHAFALVGHKTLFASHLTMFMMDEHAFQFLIEVSLPEPERSKLAKLQKDFPHDSFFLGNVQEDEAVGEHQSDPMTISALASGLRKDFIGCVFHGIPDKPTYNEWPWVGVKPVLAEVPIRIERIVHFRPLVAALVQPDPLLYLLFGAGDEAHMVNFQTRYPDVDHVLSLRGTPDWLPQEMLRASVIVDLPNRSRLGGCLNPIEDGSMVDVRYRGKDVPRMIHVDFSSWFCTKIVNMPDDPCQTCTRRCGTPTPARYMSTASVTRP